MALVKMSSELARLVVASVKGTTAINMPGKGWRGSLGCWAPTLVDAECALASKAPVDGLGPSQTGNLLTDVTFQGGLPGNEAEAESVLDHGKPSGRKVQALAISAAYRVTRRRRRVVL